MNPTTRLTFAALASISSFALAQTATLDIDASKPGIAISPSLYGIFFEEINYAGDGGIYPELLRNRNFEDNDKTPESWSLVLGEGAKGSATLGTRPEGSQYNRHHLTLTRDADSKGSVGLANDGFWGVVVRKNSIYKLSILARAKSSTKIKVSLANRAGEEYASASADVATGDAFKPIELQLTSGMTDPVARLVISLDAPGSVDLDYVSLMPTGEIANGVVAPKSDAVASKYRSDLFDKLKGLTPAFMRFPGGCWVEGEVLANASRWKRTVGPLQDRWTQPNLWGYHSNNGLGYHEYLQLCEDLNCSALFVINVGMSHRGVVPMDQMGEFVQDALDAIEYATGPVDSKYGKMRADAGHPAPFKLEYMEIGNENGGPAYNERYALFYKAIKAKYPQMKLVACEWAGGHPTSPGVDIIDEHYYDTPQFFFRNAHKYDTYDRKGPKVYVGEYAVTINNGTGRLIGALGEAAFMTGMERNSDVVVMSSYAPLFAQVSGKGWNPDLINFDSARSYGTPSYYVQKMFSNNRGDVVLPADLKVSEPPKPEPAHGTAGVATWRTQAQFKDFKVTGADGKVLYTSNFANREGWTFSRERSFQVRDGMLVQRGEEDDTRATVGDVNWTDYTVEVKARKTGGDEGFIVQAHTESSGDYVWFNIGGWGNTRSAIERRADGGKQIIGEPADFKVEPDRWYDLKLEVKGEDIRGYVDGKLIASAKDERKPIAKVFAASSRDNATGDVIIKLVNGGDAKYTTQINVKGLPKHASSATAQVLSGNPEDENTLDAPEKVSPTETKVDLSGDSIKYDAPPYSVTILRIGGTK